MLVIRSSGRQEYKLQLRMQFSDYTCKCCGLLGVNEQDMLQPALWWRGMRWAALPGQPALHRPGQTASWTVCLWLSEQPRRLFSVPWFGPFGHAGTSLTHLIVLVGQHEPLKLVKLGLKNQK